MIMNNNNSKKVWKKRMEKKWEMIPIIMNMMFMMVLTNDNIFFSSVS